MDVVRAMEEEAQLRLSSLRVDGGMVVNNLLMQFQASILDTPVVRPRISETTALGAAYAAGLAVGFWNNLDELRAKWDIAQEWAPKMESAERQKLEQQWKKAVERTLNWEETS